jgi:hypothetical protein
MSKKEEKSKGKPVAETMLDETFAVVLKMVRRAVKNLKETCDDIEGLLTKLEKLTGD